MSHLPQWAVEEIRPCLPTEGLGWLAVTSCLGCTDALAVCPAAVGLGGRKISRNWCPVNIALQSASLWKTEARASSHWIARPGAEDRTSVQCMVIVSRIASSQSESESKFWALPIPLARKCNRLAKLSSVSPSPSFLMLYERRTTQVVWCSCRQLHV